MCMYFWLATCWDDSDDLQPIRESVAMLIFLLRCLSGSGFGGDALLFSQSLQVSAIMAHNLL